MRHHYQQLLLAVIDADGIIVASIVIIADCCVIDITMSVQPHWNVRVFKHQNTLDHIKENAYCNWC